MGVGLEVYDPSGNLLLDLSRRVFRQVASVTYTNVNGSASFTARDEDTIFIAVAPGAYTPYFTFSGKTVSWDQSGVNAAVRHGGTAMIWAY